MSHFHETFADNDQKITLELWNDYIQDRNFLWNLWKFSITKIQTMWYRHARTLLNMDKILAIYT